MTPRRAFALAALVSCAASLKLDTDPLAGLKVLGLENVSNRLPNSTFRTVFQYSEMRLGPPMLPSEACSAPWSNESTNSEWKWQPPKSPPPSAPRTSDPPFFPEAGIGARRLMYPLYNNMSFQLFLPLEFTADKCYPMPVVVYLHSHATRKWSVMNSDSLPRMLARNQGTAFDDRSCWCLDASAETAVEDLGNSTHAVQSTTNTSTDDEGLLVDCTFADKFPGIVIMPQGCTEVPPYDKCNTSLWTDEVLENVTNLTRAIIDKFNGNAERVMVTGTGEGGEAALRLASTVGKGLFNFVAATDPLTAAGTPLTYTGGLDDVTVWITGDAEDGLAGNDDYVVQLKQRPKGNSSLTRYKRYVETPKSADPSLSNKTKHSSDIIYRNAAFWSAVWHTPKTKDGRMKWGLPKLPDKIAPWHS